MTISEALGGFNRGTTGAAVDDAVPVFTHASTRLYFQRNHDLYF